MVIEDERDPSKLSSYKQQFCGEEKKDLEKFLKTVTPAGKSCYDAKESNNLVRPQDYQKQKMEEKMNAVAWKTIDNDPHLERKATGQSLHIERNDSSNPVIFNENHLVKKLPK